MSSDPLFSATSGRIMPRETLQFWICRADHINRHSGNKCSECFHTRTEIHAQVHASERAIIYRGPNGERATPARSDLPMPSRYASRGYVREEILSMSAYEKSSGSVHEASNFSSGNEPSALPEPSAKGAPPALRDKLINQIRDAMASGPWTSSPDQATKVFGITPPIA